MAPACDQHRWFTVTVHTLVTLPKLEPRPFDTEEDGRSVVVLIPVFNDWAAASLLLPRLDAVCGEHGIRARVLLVDDGSNMPVSSDLARFAPASLTAVGLLRLRRNLGHQRAIAIGLTYIDQHFACDAVVVMDGDGEDDPRDVPRLLDRLRQEDDRAVVFAARRKRSEGLLFRASYAAYRALHLLVTGIPVNVGNFSAIPRAQLRRLVVVSELWNHYAAAVFRSRIPYVSVPTVRMPRLSGRTSMSFVALTVHGLSALAVHGELVGVRLLLATLAAVGLFGTAFVAVIAIKVSTDLALPGWASIAAGLSLVLLTQFIVLSAVFAMLALSGRANASFIPVRDYAFFVDDEEALYPRERDGVTVRSERAARETRIERAGV